MTNNKAHLSPKVIDLFRPERVISPPEGWELRGSHGFNRAKNAEGKNIDLARLGDVLDWLEDSQELPGRKHALIALLERLEIGIRDGVYELDWDDFANLSPDVTLTVLQQEINKCWQRDFTKVKVAPRGDRPFVEWDVQLQETTQITNHSGYMINYWAVPITAAYAAWGYGRIEAPAVDAGVTQKPSLTAQDVTDWETLVSYRKNTRKGARWDDKQRQVLKAELTRRIKTDKSNKGESQIKEEMASELGLESRQAIAKQINAMGSISKRDTKRGRLAG